MKKLNVKRLLKDTRRKLEGKDAHRLTAVHTGVTVAAALIITFLQYVLAEGISNTTGLSGMGTRSVLETLQTVLQWANTVLMPFWSLGFLYAAMQWARERYVQKADLLTGFRRFGPCLGLLLNRALLTISVLIICAQLSSILYMMTPAAASITSIADAAGGDMNVLAQMMTEMDLYETMDLFYAMIPMLVIWVGLSALLLIPLMYRFRMAEYVILDQPGMRAMPAMLLSASLLRRRCWQMFRLDLRFWWYYGLKVLCLVICYGDLLLPLIGVELPFAGDGAYLITYGLYLAAVFAVEVAFRPRVETAYAAVYDALVELGPAKKKAPEKPQNLPWDAQ